MTTKTKEELKNEVELHRQALENDFHEVVEGGRKAAKRVAIFAGGFLAIYTVVRLLTRKKVVVEDGKHSKRNVFKVEEKKSSVAGSIGKMLLTQATLLAIGFAKNRIKDYLENIISPDDENDDSK
ncbi:MAG: hypothetical protein P8X57_03300 [Cyclobacteriaceae bacterium]